MNYRYKQKERNRMSSYMKDPNYLKRHREYQRKWKKDNKDDCKIKDDYIILDNVELIIEKIKMIWTI